MLGLLERAARLGEPTGKLKGLVWEAKNRNNARGINTNTQSAKPKLSEGSAGRGEGGDVLGWDVPLALLPVGLGFFRIPAQFWVLQAWV